MPMKFISWNVNGLRACLKKGFLDFLPTGGPRLLLPSGDQDGAGTGGCGAERRGLGVLELCGEEGILRHRRFHPPTSLWLWPTVWTRTGTTTRGGSSPWSMRASIWSAATPQLPGRPEAAGLPHGVGGRPAGLPHVPGPAQAGGLLRGPERGPPGDRPEKPKDQPEQRRLHRPGAGKDDLPALLRLYRHLPLSLPGHGGGSTPGGPTASTPGRTTRGGASTISSSPDRLRDKIKRAEILTTVEGSDHCPVLLELDI